MKEPEPDHGIPAACVLLFPRDSREAGSDCMADDTAEIDRLRQLSEDATDDLGGSTIVIEDTDIMATREMKQLLEVEPDDDEIQDNQPE
jgi:hypothetical protein